jgi:ribosome-associated heat shock protein Hsp15
MDEPVRLDKWLWAARLYKTRSLAADEAGLGRITVNGVAAKPGRDLRVGDLITLRRAGLTTAVEVLALSARRGPAVQAQTLYRETAESRAERERLAEARRMAPDPAATQTQGRPTKRDRRSLADWQRWSARSDD